MRHCNVRYQYWLQQCTAAVTAVAPTCMLCTHASWCHTCMPARWYTRVSWLAGLKFLAVISRQARWPADSKSMCANTAPARQPLALWHPKSIAAVEQVQASAAGSYMQIVIPASQHQSSGQIRGLASNSTFTSAATHTGICPAPRRLPPCFVCCSSDCHRRDCCKLQLDTHSSTSASPLST